MPENDQFWDFYWEVRLQAIQDLGKKEAILEVSKLIRKLTTQAKRPIRLLELGCGEGQIIGALVEGHSEDCPSSTSVGVDYKSQSIGKCRHDYPGMHFIEGDFTDGELLKGLGQFEIVLLVNALHEVFSAGFCEQLGEVDVPTAKAHVIEALGGAARCMAPGGKLLLFDGLEPSGDPQAPIRVRFLHSQGHEHFEIFAREYHPFKISYRETGEPFCIELSRHDFTRFITKSIFLGKQLWESERLESYQYFTTDEFLAAFAHLGLPICEMRTLTVDDEKWRSLVEIETPGVDFPDEHILIVAQKENG